MKLVLAIGVAAALCGSLPARAQTDDLLARSLPSTSTGPTVPDTRQIDQAMLPPASANWRTSDNLNGGPTNPNGAPVGSSVSITSGAMTSRLQDGDSDGCH